jgi:hypothetical protein
VVSSRQVAVIFGVEFNSQMVVALGKGSEELLKVELEAKA